MNEDCTVKICDFGFSIIIKENLQLLNTICGTPLFMSPELLYNKPYTIKSEIWSLGIIFYYILRIYFYFYKEIRYILIYWYMNFDDLDGNNYAFSNHLSVSGSSRRDDTL